MTTPLTSSTTTAFLGAFVGPFLGDLDRAIGAFTFGTLAPVFFALYTTSCFFFIGDFGGAGFNICNSYANWAAACFASFSASFCFQISALAAHYTF
jgi:hypothetical protein